MQTLNRFFKALHQTRLALDRQLTNIQEVHRRNQSADVVVVDCECCPGADGPRVGWLRGCRHKAEANTNGRRGCQVSLRCRKTILKINHRHLLQVGIDTRVELFFIMPIDNSHARVCSQADSWRVFGHICVYGF